MFKLSRKVEYALMALSYLHKNKNLTSVRDISTNLHVPFDTVSKVLQILNSHSIVGAEKGINGGYFLKNSLSTINLYDFCQLLEPQPLTRNCKHNEGKQSAQCELIQHCNITSSIFTFNVLISNFLKQISLEELLTNPTKIKQFEAIKMEI